MPLYEFECPSCQHRFDAMKSISERHQAEPCPACDAPAQMRIAGAAILSGAVPCGGQTGGCPGAMPLGPSGGSACGGRRGGCAL